MLKKCLAAVAYQLFRGLFMIFICAVFTASFSVFLWLIAKTLLWLKVIQVAPPYLIIFSIFLIPITTFIYYNVYQAEHQIMQILAKTEEEIIINLADKPKF